MSKQNNRELLELAAKAAGIETHDAMRLAVRLGLSVSHDKVGRVCAVYLGDVFYSAVSYKDNPIAATCRAIVCAAARMRC